MLLSDIRNASATGASRATPVRGDVARWVAIVAIEILIGIHLILTPMHLEELFYVGVLFSVGNALLFAAMVLLAGRRHRSLGWLLASAVCIGEFVGFVLSRTVGLPLGYHEAWAAGPEDYLGLACLFCELVVVAAAGVRLPSVGVGRRRTIIRDLDEPGAVTLS